MPSHAWRPSGVVGLTALLATALVGLVSCGPTPNQYLAEPEREFGVSRTGADLRVYHAALLTPNGIGLREPGFLVGVENLHPESAEFAPANDPNRRQGERHVLTHIVRYNLGDPADPKAAGVRSCVLFSILDRDDPDPDRRLFQRCPGVPPYQVTAGSTASSSQGEAIARLREGITLALTQAAATKPLSHILVVVMGWNTDQVSALANFDSLAGNLADVARERGETFRPLVIGLSWPSKWQLGEWSVVPDILIRGLSFPFKRRDANDTGVHVLRDLVLEGVLPGRRHAPHADGQVEPPIVLIGHSFGARALVRALATQRAAGAGFLDTDRLLLLQGAFEFKDLFQKHGQGPLAEAFDQARPRVTMTASRYDSAVAAAFWGQYAGDIDTFDKACRGEKGRFLGTAQMPGDLAPIGCAELRPGAADFALDVCTVTEDDPAPLARALDGRPVRYFDASRLINCQPPFSGGGAHSDVFRRETAQFLWSEIEPQPAQERSPDSSG